MRHFSLITCTASLFAVSSFAADIPRGAKIFIAPMENGLDGFIAPEIIKKKAPIVLVSDEASAK